MKHLGDITKINGAEVEPVDVITFGSPCQDMSVAGKREGMKHAEQGDEETTRSGLFYEAVRTIKEMREATNGEYPKYAVWENVPGAFSSNKGHDFHAVLEALCSVCDDAVSIPKPYDRKRPDKLVWSGAGNIVGDSYSVAWRTLDAQYWGVPQRRKRIYLVADFTGRRAGEILFKPDSLRGHMSQGNEAGQGASADAVGGVDGSVGVECLNPWDCQSKRIYKPDGIYCTLPAMDCGGANNQAVIYSFDSLSSNSMKSANPKSGCRAVEIAKCIDTTYPDPSKNQGGIAVVQPLVLKERAGCAGGGKGALWSDKAFTLATSQDMSVCAMATQQGGAEIADNLCPTITAAAGMSGNNQPVIAFAQNQRDEVRDLGDKAGALQARDYKGVGNQYVGEDKLVVECYGVGNGDVETLCFDETQVTSPTNGNNPHWNDPSHPLASTARPPTVICKKPPRKYIIRRLTPTECARLQGFPDNWGHLAPFDPADAEFWEDVRKTHAEINGKKYKPVKDIKKWYEKLHADSTEYKMWGNGIALPCAEYVIRGIAEQGAKTLGSLFDGSGGFPLAGAMNGIKPLWASEIEPFPIAVTKYHFGGLNE